MVAEVHRGGVDGRFSQFGDDCIGDVMPVEEGFDLRFFQVAGVDAASNVACSSLRVAG